MTDAASLKACCASLYGSDAARFLLGETFHPGGTVLTLEVAEMLHLDAGSRVLDIASGRGTSAFAIADRFGCDVVGIDLSDVNVAESNTVAAKRGLQDRVRFIRADAEDLPFEPETFDALLCECAFCTFPDKPKAAAEFSRVLRPRGMIGISDLTRAAAPLPELDGLLAWIACIGDAMPLGSYAKVLSDAGFAIVATESRDQALREMIEQIRGKLFLAEILTGLKKLEIPGFDIRQVKHFAGAAADAVRERQLGYAFVIGERPVS